MFVRQEWYVMGKCNYRSIKLKRALLYVKIFDGETGTLLAPVLGQYGIKPIDFLSKVQEKYIGDIDAEAEDIMQRIKLHVKGIKFSIEKIEYTQNYIYNLFVQRVRRIPFDFFFAYKLKLKFNKNGLLQRLLRR